MGIGRTAGAVVLSYVLGIGTPVATNVQAYVQCRGIVEEAKRSENPFEILGAALRVEEMKTGASRNPVYRFFRGQGIDACIPSMGD